MDNIHSFTCFCSYYKLKEHLGFFELALPQPHPFVSVSHSRDFHSLQCHHLLYINNETDSNVVQEITCSIVVIVGIFSDISCINGTVDCIKCVSCKCCVVQMWVQITFRNSNIIKGSKYNNDYRYRSHIPLCHQIICSCPLI